MRFEGSDRLPCVYRAGSLLRVKRDHQWQRANMVHHFSDGDLLLVLVAELDRGAFRHTVVQKNGIAVIILVEYDISFDPDFELAHD